MSNKIINRLNRLTGQINGISKMISENKDCEQIIIQFQAAQSALNSAFNEFLKINLNSCLNKNSRKNKQKINKILEMLSKK